MQSQFTVDRLLSFVYDTPAAMAKKAAQVGLDCLKEAIAQRGTATAILATGASQILFLDYLITLAKESQLPWQQVTFFHLDEYLGIEDNHPASFRRYLREKVEARLPGAQFHYIEGDTLEPLKEGDRYTQLLQRQPLDLCCLGLGENGHIAFNEPHLADFNDPYTIKLVKLDARNRQQQVKQGNFQTLETVPLYAFTLTIPLIASTRKIICLAPEKRKAEIVKLMLQGEISPNCPASILRQWEQALLFLDRESASLL